MSISLINLWNITPICLCPIPGQFDQNCMSYVQISTSQRTIKYRSWSNIAAYIQTGIHCYQSIVYQFLTGLWKELARYEVISEPSLKTNDSSKIWCTVNSCAVSGLQIMAYRWWLQVLNLPVLSQTEGRGEPDAVESWDISVVMPSVSGLQLMASACKRSLSTITLWLLFTTENIKKSY